MFLPFIRGAILVMVNQSSQKDPFRLLEVMKETGVTVMQATPTTYEVGQQPNLATSQYINKTQQFY